MQVRDKLYIDGRWVPSTGTGTIDVICSSTEEVMAKVPDGTVEDADRAVRAARGAFQDWAATSVTERAALLKKIRDGLKERADEIGQTIAMEVGMPVKLATKIQAGLPLMSFGTMAKILPDFPFEERIGNSLVLREPVGVVAAITPWNYPLHQIACKVAPALAAGCTVVLKPSKVAPVNAFILAEIIAAAGLPDGAFNLVTGHGSLVGEALVGHPEVDLVSFTGSTRAGKRIYELASQTVKRVTLELGGKSASVILEDADLPAAVKGTVSACFLNSGQTCSAHTRMLVPESKYAEAAQLAVAEAAKYTVGDPFAETSKLGPLVSKTQLERVRSYIRKGIEEGAELLCGGPEASADLEKGWYVKPTVFGRVDSQATIAQEEIFGPVLSIITYKDEEDAVRIANDSIYGLGGGVWSQDEDRAVRVARRIRTGQVDINGGPFNPQAPFGGYKQSGNGRENGRPGLEEFLEYKSLQLKPQPKS
ncbi:MAG: aldehyde dehydrogenase family protein [Desulfomonilaceae bacterium]|nr:aldehyde dehydrogenase family protein [Desulfomonilaceae bacterium]